MIRRPPRSTPLYSSAASDVYKRQQWPYYTRSCGLPCSRHEWWSRQIQWCTPVSYTHLRAHETKANLVCRLLLEKKKKKKKKQTLKKSQTNNTKRQRKKKKIQ